MYNVIIKNYLSNIAITTHCSILNILKSCMYVSVCIVVCYSVCLTYTQYCTVTSQQEQATKLEQQSADHPALGQITHKHLY